MDYSVRGIERLKKDCAAFAVNKALMKLVEILMSPDEEFIDNEPDNFFGTSDFGDEEDEEDWDDEEDFDDDYGEYDPRDFPQPMW